MQRMLSIVGATLGGWIGWWLGSRVGFFTAFMVSVVGTGAGMYLARRISRYYFG